MYMSKRKSERQLIIMGVWLLSQSSPVESAKIKKKRFECALEDQGKGRAYVFLSARENDSIIALALLAP